MSARHLKSGKGWLAVAMMLGLVSQAAFACRPEEGEEGEAEEAEEAEEGEEAQPGAAATAPQDSIPTVVMNALNARFPAAVIRKWTREEEEGVVLYDIEFTQEGRACEADIRADGGYVNFERAIAAEDLPEVVRRAVGGRYPGATLKEVMEITAVTGGAEALEGYEVVLETADAKQAEVTVAPDGRILEDSGVGGGDPS